MCRQIGHFYTGKKSTFANLAGKKAEKFMIPLFQKLGNNANDLAPNMTFGAMCAIMLA